jgi:DUF971 family protein
MPTPKEIRPSGDRAMLVLWDDGQTSEYSFRLLRKACPCATCEDMRRSRKEKKEMDDRYQLRLITQESPSDDPVLVRVDWVGNYALRLVWEDGHDTGIYHFQALRDLSGKVEEEI